ncbi:16S rRNA (cytidine(1402)-2'-O)-methyltransferase [Candidatus Calescamantes bacterium]|nr:16S rRNA (cytidine(1402)-2'-O)-methyltransferase [Candidatus Calescamantes bacterium]MCK5399465.1 16S rRNA (cytidine(1402)-2'-O)-methyltransferase [bacterium]MCK5599895.1 16S rRNA (cytidine(1402)-2'-O)-methyltransferase [bacterium]
MSGTLTIVGAPIGNLASVDSLFAKALKQADLILCEDTRVTGKLLNLKGITPVKMMSYREENEERMAKKALEFLAQGLHIVLLSDAGMPLVSDPGYRLVHMATESGYDTSVVHGPSAFMEALLRSGFGTDRFVFLGFLPKKGKKLTEAVELMSGYDMTFVFYESPYRIRKTMKLLQDRLPESRYAICRELTKMHEEFLRGQLSQLNILDIKEKGEFTVVLRRER